MPLIMGPFTGLGCWARMPSPVAFSTVKSDTLTLEALILMPLSSPVASIVAPSPARVRAFETATSSLYVPVHTTMVSPGAAALTAALMVPYDAVVHDVPAAPAAPVG